MRISVITCMHGTCLLVVVHGLMLAAMPEDALNPEEVAKEVSESIDQSDYEEERRVLLNR